MKTKLFVPVNILFLLAGLIVVFTSCIKREQPDYNDPSIVDAPEEINLSTLIIPSGTFLMGSPPNEPYHQIADKQFEVTIDSFIISVYETTNEQFAAFLNKIKVGSNQLYKEGLYPNEVLSYGPPGLFWTGDKWKLIAGYEKHPVTFVSWFGAYEFARYVGGRLPSEAEWEYAARAGTSTPFHTGLCLHNSEANYYWNKSYDNCENSVKEYPGKTQETGTYPANAFGLYDMHGNVQEWCNDWYDFYPKEPQINPKGPDSGKYRILRGGSWNVEAGYCRSAHRANSWPYTKHGFIGFRVAFDIK